MFEFEVQDMSCGHCVNAVTQAVKQVDPGARVEVDLGTKKVTVDSGQQQRAAFAQALAEAGYPPAT